LTEENTSDLVTTNAAIISVDNGKMDKNTADISIHQIYKNLGKIDQSFLTPELLAQIAGTAGVNVITATKSVTEPMMAITVVIGSKSKNLFNKATAVPNSYITETGTVGTVVGCYISDWIPVLPNTTYHKKAFNSAAF
jgi:hypothetical protein